MGGFFSGLAGSIGDHLHEQHLLNLQQQVQAKRDLLDNYNVLMKDPHMVDVHDQIAQVLLKAAGTDPTKLHKQIGKPGGEYDPTQWQVLAQQRASGQQPSPQNQGQNPTTIPAPPAGQMPGQAQIAQPYNEAKAQQDAQQAAMQPPQPQIALDGTPINGRDQLIQDTEERNKRLEPQNWSPAGQLIQPPPPPISQMATGMASQSTQQMPGPGPAPSGGDVVGVGQASAGAGASAMIPPPPLGQQMAPTPDWASSHGAMGGLTDKERKRRQLEFSGQEDEQRQQAEMRRMQGVASFNTGEEQKKIQNHIRTLQTIKDPVTGKSVWDSMGTREKAAVATGITSLGTNMRPLSMPGVVPGTSAPEGQLDFSGNPIDPHGQYRLRPNPGGEIDWVPQAVQQRLQWVMDPNDPQKQVLMSVNPYDPNQNTAVKDLSKINPAMIPQVSNSSQWKQVTQPDGSIALVPVNVSSTRQRSLGGAAPQAPIGAAAPTASPARMPAGKGVGSAGSAGMVAPPPPMSDSGMPALPRGAIIAGGRPLTPEQVITNGQKLGALDSTIELVQRVQKNMGLLGNLIDAKKIEMQIDPHQGIFKAAVNRAVPMSPEEAQLAGDFASLMEHINTLRGPLGATGFRGEEAFSALQAQRGQLMANPAVTSQVLANTLKALNRTRDPIAKGLKRAGQDTNTSGVQAPPAGAGGDGKVIVVAPDGKTSGRIPAARLQDYLSHGYTQPAAQ